MEALLAMNAPAPAGNQAPAPVANAVVAVQHAFSDSVATLAVDAIVNHFAGADSGAPVPAGTQPPPVDSSALEALLLASITPPVEHAVLPMSTTTIDDHQAALAAAA
jgi:hypothetical protein